MDENSTSSQNPSVESSAKRFSILQLPALPIIGMAAIAFVIIVGAIYLFKFNGVNEKNLNQKAAMEMATGNYGAAKKTYKSVLKEDNKNLTALNGIISANSLEGNETGNEVDHLRESQQYIDSAMDLYSNEALTLQTVGYAYETAGDYKKALDLYDKAAKIDPESSEVWFHKGHVLQFLNRESEAQEAYMKAYSLDPNNPFVLIVRGNKFAEEGNLVDAYQSFIKASTSSALSPSTRAGALTAASNMRRLQAGDNQNSTEMNEALLLSKQAVDASPDFAPALGAYGLNLAITGDRKKGIEYIERAIKVNSRISRNYFLLGYVLIADKKYTEAVNLISDAIDKINQDNTLLGESNKSLEKGMYLYQLAKVYYVMDRPLSEVVPILQESILLNPGMRNTLKLDFQNGGFSELRSNSDFLALVNK